MSVSITCYDGVLSIGGNKILLEDEERETRLFFDFGLPFARRYLFFEEYLKPRAGVGQRVLRGAAVKDSRVYALDEWDGDDRTREHGVEASGIVECFRPFAYNNDMR